ncbi:MAG: helix-turn-helix domain containing protein [Rhodospirillaceae bacterium]|nr:helix-turn-helix domain containing protein [Rhodospirillaceae bacterium]
MTVTTKRRRTRQEHREETSERIILAAFDVIRRRGYSGFRIAEAQEVAGVSRGALLHYFPTKEALALAALEYAFAASRAEAESRARDLADAADPIEEIIRDSEAFFFGDHFLVALDILMSAGKDPAIRSQVQAIARAHRLPVERAWLDVLRTADIPEHLAEDILWLTISMIRGLAIRAFWQDEPARFERLHLLWRDMLVNYLAAVRTDKRTRLP